jgi:hypothetical protein
MLRFFSKIYYSEEKKSANKYLWLFGLNKNATYKYKGVRFHVHFAYYTLQSSSNSGKYHLLWHLMALHLWISYDSHNKQKLYPHTEWSYLICNAEAARTSISPAITIMRPLGTVSAALQYSICRPPVQYLPPSSTVSAALKYSICRPQVQYLPPSSTESRALK